MMDDLFDEVHSLEDSEIERGRQEGYNDGLAMGLLEGRELGVQKGYELGMLIYCDIPECIHFDSPDSPDCMQVSRLVSTPAAVKLGVN